MGYTKREHKTPSRGTFKATDSVKGTFKGLTIHRSNDKRGMVMKGDAFKTVTRGGKRFALVPVEMIDQLRLGGAGPALPKPDAAGNVPAVEWAAATIVRGLIDDMKAAGLSQAALSRLSGVRAETLNRIIKGHVTPDVATLAKLNNAIQRHTAGKVS